MKFGKTLRQRSIPAWQAYNIDYEEIKNFIKENTTPGNGKAVSVPGTGDETARHFEEALYDILRDQHERINLFVRSKAGEIKRRLEHLELQIDRFASRDASFDRGISAKRLERYGRIESDVLKIGDEIRSLSRFTSVQSTAFRKLLKKYKKWTGSAELGYRFNDKVLDKASSFANTDLSPLFSQYDALLSTVRTLYEDRINDSGKGSGREPPRRGFQEAQQVIQSGSHVEFDTLLATLPLGSAGQNAVYWVHPENLVELQVLLLQYARSHLPRRRQSAATTPASTPTRKGSSTPAVHDGKGHSDTFDLIADDPDQYIAQQSSKTLDKKEDHEGAVLQNAIFHARWTTDDDALVAVRPSEEYDSQHLENVVLKQKHLQSLLDSSLTFSAQKACVPTVAFEGATSSAATKVDNVREWIVHHPEVKHLTTISSSRSRFFDLAADASSLSLVSLDSAVGIEAGTADAKDARDQDNAATSFPFAVLRVRQEGPRASNLVQVLDESHLVERVRGFSLEYHAVWQCCQPSSITPPLWLPLLEKDIRKLPRVHTQTGHRTSDSRFGSQSTTPHVSTATSSDASHFGEGTAVGEDPITSLDGALPEQLTRPPLGAFRKKRKRAYAPQKTGRIQQGAQYWSEYDHPSDSDHDDGFVIYINPEDKSLFDKFWLHVEDFFHKRRSSSTHRPLLSPSDLGSTSHDGDDTASSDEEAQAKTKQSSKRSYGSIMHTGHAHTHTHAHTHQASTALEAAEPKMLLPQLSVICLASSVIILLVAFLLAATGRRKLASEVDGGIIFAVASSLVFAVTGVAAMFRHRRALQWYGWALAMLVLGGVAVASGALLAWVIT